ncbi:MAG: hypothetical protein HUJ66_02445 [Oscillospiraceae bacterium]|nr:hypothetical protein [Oscillospiraceae bacterium]
MEIKYRISERAKDFLQEHLPAALEAETSFAALKMLYELIDDKGFEAPKYDRLNEFGELADEIYDEIYELNMGDA